MRLVKTAIILVGSFIFSVVVSLVLNLVLASSSSSQSAIQGLATLAIFAYWAYLATKVGYRKRDALLGLIPFYGLFWICRIAYRVAYLPNNDWDLLNAEES